MITSPPYWGLRSYQGDPGMIGLEPTFEEHLDNLMAVFREVRRVLRKDGTLWLNYGDAYARGEGRGTSGGPGKQQTNIGSINQTRPASDPRWPQAKRPDDDVSTGGHGVAKTVA